jgi:hypothetical protein
MSINSTFFQLNHPGHRYIRTLHMGPLQKKGRYADFSPLADTALQAAANLMMQRALDLLTPNTLQYLMMPEYLPLESQTFYSLSASQHNLRHLHLGITPLEYDLKRVAPAMWLNHLETLIIPRCLRGKHDLRFYGQVLANLAALPNLLIASFLLFMTIPGISDEPTICAYPEEGAGPGMLFRQMLAGFNSLTTSSPRRPTKVTNLFLRECPLQKVSEGLPYIVDLDGVQTLMVMNCEGGDTLLDLLSRHLEAHRPLTRTLRCLRLFGHLKGLHNTPLDDVLRGLPLLEYFHREDDVAFGTHSWSLDETQSWTCPNLKHFGIREGQRVGVAPQKALVLQSQEQLGRIISMLRNVEQLAVAIQMPRFNRKYLTTLNDEAQLDSIDDPESLSLFTAYWNRLVSQVYRYCIFSPLTTGQHHISAARNLKILRFLTWPSATADFLANFPSTEYDRALDSTAAATATRLHALHVKRGTTLPLKLLIIGSFMLDDPPIDDQGGKIKDKMHAVCYAIDLDNGTNGHSEVQVRTRLLSSQKSLSMMLIALPLTQCRRVTPEEAQKLVPVYDALTNRRGNGDDSMMGCCGVFDRPWTVR